ncbi:MAG: hypothetical protein M1833_002388 [Piccolia ochrophora]|nr:MAG: hypothetical protein M1833_002388 [Piccolia ochrophora]
MGWFSPADVGPKVSKDGTPEAPNRTDRAHCWESRDAFFKCLDRNGIVDSIKDQSLASERCGAEDQAFGKNCASSWVQYFKKRRVMEINRNESMARLQAEGAQALPSQAGGRTGGSP